MRWSNRRFRFVPLLLAACSLVVLASCDNEPKRTWRPSDHVQPPESEVSASRVAEDADPQQDENPRLRAAASLWRVTCARCHGPSGRGNGPERPPGARMPDLSNAAWQRSRTDRQIATTIVRGGNQMPAFGDRLSQEGIDALVTHVRRLGGLRRAGEASADAGTASPSDGGAAASPDAGTRGAEAPTGGASQ